jgi:hypothetical protein
LGSTLATPSSKLSLFKVYLEQYAKGVLNSLFKIFKLGGKYEDVNNFKIKDILFDLKPQCKGVNYFSHFIFGSAPNFIKNYTKS